MAFIDEHWSKNHILSWHRGIVDFQHRERDNTGYTFRVARSEGKILGILGYIPSRLYDPALTANNTVWLALWKVRSDCEVAGLGLLLLRELLTNEPHESAGVVGIGNVDHLRLYRALGFTTGELRQYYRVRPGLGELRLLRQTGNAFQANHGGVARLADVDSLDDLQKVFNSGYDFAAAKCPARTPRYLYERFLLHPVYVYRIRAVTRGGSTEGYLVYRVAEHENTRAVRIVEYGGTDDVFAELGPALDSILVDEDAEYIDFWQSGMEEASIIRAGFARVDPDGSIVVPNYFEPFVQRNARIHFAFKAQKGRRPRIFRADGDQDRPNLIDTASERRIT